MTLAAFKERLARCQKVGLDTSAFQLYLRGDARLGALTLALFEAIEQGQVQGVASTLTLQELLVEPYKAKDDAAVQDFNVLLPTFPNLALIPVSRAIADKAALFQARFGLDPIASAQAATASLEGADAFVVGNGALASGLSELNIISLEEYL